MDKTCHPTTALILSLPMPNSLGQGTTLANGMFLCVSLKGLRVGLWTLSSQQDLAHSTSQKPHSNFRHPEWSPQEEKWGYLHCTSSGFSERTKKGDSVSEGQEAVGKAGHTAAADSGCQDFSAAPAPFSRGVAKGGQEQGMLEAHGHQQRCQLESTGRDAPQPQTSQAPVPGGP